MADDARFRNSDKFTVPELNDLREALREQENTRPPGLPEEPQYAQTSYIVPPIMIPRENANLDQLISVLSDRFRVQVDRSPIERMPNQEVPISGSDLLGYLIRTDQSIGFVNGMLNIDRPERHTAIIAVQIGTETYAASVVGSTIESSYVAQATAEVLWETAGAPKRWSDIEQSVQKIAYKTTSRFNLGINVEDWFRPSFRDFMAHQITAEGSAGTRMGRRAAEDNDVSHHDKIMVVADICEIHMRVSQFNTVTGRAEDCEVSFSVDVRDNARHGIVSITTELPSAEHTTLVDALRNALSHDPE